MAIIGVGINENVILQKVELVDKEGKYSLDFTFGDSDATISDNPFEEKLDENGYVVTGSGTTIKLWPVSVPDDEDKKGAVRNQKQKYDIVYKEIGEQRNLLTQFALCYMQSKDVNGKINPYRDSGLTADNMYYMLPTEDVLNRVFKNMAEDFVALITPKLAEEAVPLRLLLIRQSAKKHFATFRRNFIREQPIVEMAVIKKEYSKLKFSDYEIKNGLNSGAPITTAAADNTPPADMNEEDVFGKGDDQPVFTD